MDYGVKKSRGEIISSLKIISFIFSWVFSKSDTFRVYAQSCLKKGHNSVIFMTIGFLRNGQIPNDNKCCIMTCQSYDFRPEILLSLSIMLFG